MARRTDRRPPSNPLPSSQQIAQRSQLLSAESWTGPLPPPSALGQFNAIIPNGAERIMAMVEEEQAHRISHEKRELEATIGDFRRGHWIGGLLGVLSISGAIVTAVVGAHPVVSVALVGLPIAGLVRGFLSKRR